RHGNPGTAGSAGMIGHGQLAADAPKVCRSGRACQPALPQPGAAGQARNRRSPFNTCRITPAHEPRTPVLLVTVSKLVARKSRADRRIRACDGRPGRPSWIRQGRPVLVVVSLLAPAT